MRLSIFVAASTLAVPAAPALAHCRTVHHKIYHAAWHAPVRHRAVHYASACDCGRRIAHRAVYRAAYAREPIVEVAYERPRPLLYRPYRVGYAVPLYRPRPIFYRAGFERPYFRHRWERFDDRSDRWGGYRRHRWSGWR